MAPIFGLNASQFNSKNRKKNRLNFCKTFAFIPASAGIKCEKMDEPV